MGENRERKYCRDCLIEINDAHVNLLKENPVDIFTGFSFKIELVADFFIMFTTAKLKIKMPSDFRTVDPLLNLTEKQKYKLLRIYKNQP